MTEYRVIDRDGTVLRAADLACIPDDPDNRDRAEYIVWVAAGGVPDPYAPQASPPQSIRSQDLMAQFTADDAARIKAAVNANVTFWLLWSALQAQSDSMQVTNPRFLQGWAALIDVLGQDRMAEIASDLGVTI